MKVILTDGNAIGYHASNTRKLTTADGEPTQAIFHSIKMLHNARLTFRDFTPMILWDSHAKWRYDLLPEYKGKRETNEKQIAMRQEYRAQRPAIQKAFKLMGFTQVQHEGYEADDIAGVYSRRIAGMSDAEAILWTGDKDWAQLVAENVTFLDMHTDKRIGVKNFEREFGVETVSQFLQAKALVGDGSDNINGVPGIGEKTALALMKHFGSVSALLRHHKANGDFDKGDLPDPMNRMRKAINAFCNNEDKRQQLLQRNLKLMNLHAIDPPSTGAFLRERQAPDLEGFKSFCIEYELTTLYQKADKIFEVL